MLWANLKGHNPGMAQRAKAVASRAEQRRAEATVAHRQARRDINLDSSEVQRATLVRLKDHVVRTETGRELLRIEQEFIRRGDRIALLGLNGTGKSHLIRDLMAAITRAAAGDAPLGQSITANPQLRPGYLDQHLSDLPRQMPVNLALQAASTLRDAELVRELHNIGIPIEKQATPIANLSYGEQLRVTFLLLRLRQPNIYLLDEPTNHLDIAGRERLEDLLSRDDTTCVFVTHDRRMLRGIGTRYLEIRNRRLVEVDGPDEFLERAAAARRRLHAVDRLAVSRRRADEAIQGRGASASRAAWRQGVEGRGQPADRGQGRRLAVDRLARGDDGAIHRRHPMGAGRAVDLVDQAEQPVEPERDAELLLDLPHHRGLDRLAEIDLLPGRPQCPASGSAPPLHQQQPAAIRPG